MTLIVYVMSQPIEGYCFGCLCRDVTTKTEKTQKKSRKQVSSLNISVIASRGFCLGGKK